MIPSLVLARASQTHWARYRLRRLSLLLLYQMPSSQLLNEAGCSFKPEGLLRNRFRESSRD